MDAKPVIVALAAIGIFVFSAAHCTLQPLTTGCGNKVIDDGEDCDGNYDGSANKCIDPGQPSQCRWSCESAACPASFTCGTDHVCRQSAGTFTQSLAVNAEHSRRVLLGDFDGDGAKDVVAVGETSDVHFFDKRATTKQTLLSSNGEIPALGHVTKDARTSGLLTTTFTLNGVVQGNVRVWRGSVDRTLLPTVYPNIDLSVAQVSVGHAISVIRDVSGTGSDVFALLTIQGETRLYDVTGTQSFQTPIRTSLPVGTADRIHGRIPVGGLGDVSCPTLGPFNYCQAIVLAFDGDASVSVHSTCDANYDINSIASANFVPPLTLAMPAGDIVAGPAFLVYPTSGAPTLYVQGQKGVYEFAGNSCAFDAGNPIPVIVPANKKEQVLAVGFIDDLKVVDWVDADGIHVRFDTGNGIAKVDTPPPANSAWKNARIEDLNLNGLPDVVALSDGAIDFYNGTGSTLLNGKHIIVDGTASNMAIGDYDGDFVSDIAYSSAGDSTGLTSDSINVAFGTFTGFPSQPVSVGRLSSIQQLEPTLFDYRIAGTPDFISTLFAIGTDDTSNKDLVVSILQGSPDRLINSPYFLNPAFGASLVTTAVGNFDGVSPQEGMAGLAVTLLDDTPALWYTPMTGDAQVDLTNTAVLAKLPANVSLLHDDKRGYDRAGMAAVDVGAAPGDELLIVQPGHFFLTHVKTWDVLAYETPPELGALLDKDVVTRVADVDDDGDKDVIVEYFDGKSFAAKILLNDMNGTLSFANASPLSLPTADTVAVTTIHASKDGKTQLVAVAQSGVYLAQMSGGTLGPWSPFKFDLSGVPGVHDAIAGDVDGDGVDDVVVATAGGFFVCFGDEAKP